MKNLFLLPTDKPSRLWVNNLKRRYELETEPLIGSNTAMHIYITSDEEINQQTKPCWCINTIKNTWGTDLIYYLGSMPRYHYVGFKKIILTTDPDLIKDGVQAIDDEFLEWFVKNPTCEWANVVKGKMQLNDDGQCYGFLDMSLYKIIIPKEEPKQQTIKEAAEHYAHNWFNMHETNNYKALMDGFIAGVEWQAKRMYSEEEVLTLTKKGYYTHYDSLTIDKWFEQFSKLKNG